MALEASTRSFRPTDDEYRERYEETYKTWSTLLKRTWPWDRPPPGILDAHQLFPNHPHVPVGVKTNDTGGLILPTSTWSPGGDLPCLRTQLALFVGVGRPTQVHFMPKTSSASLLNWFGRGCHLAVLIPAWLYVLSARWSDVLSCDATVEYAAGQTGWQRQEQQSTASAGFDFDVMNYVIDEENGPAPAVVHLGLIDDEAARWWAAILAPGQGWTASIAARQKCKLSSPWSISLTHTTSIRLVRAREPPSPKSSTAVSGDEAFSAIHPQQQREQQPERPPDFDTAIQYIQQYCSFHNAAEQSRAAFAAALLIPLANYDRRAVHIPVPRTTSIPPPPHPPPPKFTTPASGAEDVPQTSSARLPPPWGDDPRQLDRLLTLSWNAAGMKTLLGSLLYDPSVSSEISGAWLQGTMALLRDMKPGPRALASVFFRRRPSLGFLWLGGLLTGADKTFIGKNTWEVFMCNTSEIHAAAWTGTPVSYIQRPVRPRDDARASDGDRDGDRDQEPATIPRANEARLLYLCQGAASKARPAPLHPFPPPGATPVSDLDLEVRLHMTCHHELQFVRICWPCGDGAEVVQEPGSLLSAEGSTIRDLEDTTREDDGHDSRPPPSQGRLHGPAGENDDVDDESDADDINIDYGGMDREDDRSGCLAGNAIYWMRADDGYTPLEKRTLLQDPWLELATDSEAESDDEDDNEDDNEDGFKAEGNDSVAGGRSSNTSSTGNTPHDSQNLRSWLEGLSVGCAPEDTYPQPAAS